MALETIVWCVFAAPLLVIGGTFKTEFQERLLPVIGLSFVSYLIGLYLIPFIKIMTKEAGL